MSEGFNWMGLVITVAVAISVATTGIIVMEEFADMDWNEQVCNQKYDERWEYVNGSVDLDNQTILCRAPNGTVRETARELNLSGTAASLPES